MKILKLVPIALFSLAILFVSCGEEPDPETFRLTQTTSSATGMETDFEIIVYGTMENLTSEPITLNWSRSETFTETSWSSGICDANLCYIASISEQEITIPANSSSILDVHFYPDGRAGSGTVVMSVNEVGQTEVQTLTYSAEAL